MAEEVFLKKKLNKNTPIPLYFQLKELILDYISEANSKTVLPTEQWFCNQFGISRSTVRQALNELAVEGYIIREKGKGTSILPKKIKQDFLVVLESFNTEMQEKGMKPETTVLSASVVEPPATVQKFLKLTTDDKVVQLVRVRSINSTPIVIVTTYLPASYNNLKEIIHEDLENESMYGLMESKFNTTVISSRRMLEVRLAGDFEAKHLKTPKGAPLQYIETVSLESDDRPIEYSRAYYRGDVSKFIIETVRRAVDK